MNDKKKSGLVLILMAVLTFLLGWTAIMGWGSAKTGSMRNIRTGLDLAGGVSITYEAEEANPSDEDMSDTIYKLQQRVTQYSTEANVYRQGLNRINVEIPGVTNANEILEELGTPGSLLFTDSEGNKVLEGTDIASAEGVAYTDQRTGEHKYVVTLKMTEGGTKKFADATAANVGKTIAIIYDGETVSNPVVNEAITSGEAEISGMADIDEAKQLASFIRIGSLSLTLNEIYSNVVGAQLGTDALATSVKAGIIGIILVILFMIWAYRISGFASGWALLDFVFLDLIMMNAFDVTLTLPGIAGVILTIGMAVDANVIIYARTREELTNGLPLRRALTAGFHKAFSAIFDGNVTTLIAAAVLYFMGTGTIQGFAITLAMGVVLSMFSCLVLSRWISYALYGVGIRNEKLYGKIRVRKPAAFVRMKAITMTIGLIVLLSGFGGLMVNHSKTGKALNYSLDFIGGTATTVDFGKKMSLAELDQDVFPVVSEVTGNKDIQFQKIQDSTNVIIKTSELSLEKRQELSRVLGESFPEVHPETITAENISSVISGEMRSHAILAVVISVICMLVYIWFRFRDIRFASSAVLALVHDIGVVFAFYALLRASVGTTFIAVMLTILGYSINATIVIFDRIRENLPSMRTERLDYIVNASITQTLTRSLYSNITTFITIFVLYLMGVPSIREFSLPIMVGLIAGCFSSVFITGPLWYIMKTRIGRNRYVEKARALTADQAASAGPDPKDGKAGNGSALTDVGEPFVRAEGQDKTKISAKEKRDKKKYQSIKPKRGRNRR